MSCCINEHVKGETSVLLAKSNIEVVERGRQD